MVESKFEYTENLINKINTASIKKYNLLNEIAMAIVLIGTVILFVTSNIVLGVIFSAIFVLLLIGLIFTNKDIARSNRVLVGQQVNVVFNESNMRMITKLGNKTLYNVKFEYNTIRKIDAKTDLVFVYFNKSSAIVLPKSSFKTNGDLTRAMELMYNNYVIRTNEL